MQMINNAFNGRVEKFEGQHQCNRKSHRSRPARSGPEHNREDRGRKPKLDLRSETPFAAQASEMPDIAKPNR